MNLRIKFRSDTIDQFIERYSVDVSRGGIFVRTREPLSVGTPIKFEFQLQNESPLIAGEGTVVWIREYDASRPNVAPGMGVRFDRLSSASQPVLDKILNEKTRREMGAANARAVAGGAAVVRRPTGQMAVVGGPAAAVPGGKVPEQAARAAALAAEAARGAKPLAGAAPAAAAPRSPVPPISQIPTRSAIPIPMAATSVDSVPTAIGVNRPSTLAEHTAIDPVGIAAEFAPERTQAEQNSVPNNVSDAVTGKVDVDQMNELGLAPTTAPTKAPGNLLRQSKDDGDGAAPVAVDEQINTSREQAAAASEFDGPSTDAAAIPPEHLAAAGLGPDRTNPEARVAEALDAHSHVTTPSQPAVVDEAPKAAPDDLSVSSPVETPVTAMVSRPKGGAGKLIAISVGVVAVAAAAAVFLMRRSAEQSQASTVAPPPIAAPAPEAPSPAVQPPLQPAAEPVKPAGEPVNVAAEPVKPADEPVKAAAEPVKAAAEPVKAAAEPVKAAAEPVKAAAEPVKAAALAPGKKPGKKVAEAAPGAAPEGSEAAPPAAFVLTVASTPPGADVSIDGAVVGKTPYTNSSFEGSAAHTVSVSKDGFSSFEKSILPTAGWTKKGANLTMKVTAKLQKQKGAAASGSAIEALPDEPSGPAPEPKPAAE